MTSGEPVRTIVVMGVSGVGKSTIGAGLAKRFAFEFVEGDELHSPEEVHQMAAGHPLRDEQRIGWLRKVGQRVAAARARDDGVVTACSALRRSYRDLLREFVPDAYFVELDASKSTIHERMVARRGSFMPPSLLESQFATLEPLEPDERGVRVDVERDAHDVLDDLIRTLASRIAG